MQLGNRVVSYSQDEAQVFAHLDTGETISGDLLVWADGIHSAIRAQMIGPDTPRYTGHVAWRAVVPV